LDGGKVMEGICRSCVCRNCKSNAENYTDGMCRNCEECRNHDYDLSALACAEYEKDN